MILHYIHIMTILNTYTHWNSLGAQWLLGTAASSAAHDLPGRYGSSTEESSPNQGTTGTKKKEESKPKGKGVKPKRGKSKEDPDADHSPLGHVDDKGDDDESDDLAGLEDLLQLDGDGNPKKRPASKKTKTTGAKKRPSSKRTKNQDWYLFMSIIFSCSNNIVYIHPLSSGRICPLGSRLRATETLKS